MTWDQSLPASAASWHAGTGRLHYVLVYDRVLAQVILGLSSLAFDSVPSHLSPVTT